MSIKNSFTTLVEQEAKAKQFGFYWESLDQIINQIKSECDEIKEAWDIQDTSHLREEVGDLLNATISLSIFCNLDPQQIIDESTDKFQRRYDAVVALAKEAGYATLENQSIEVLMHFWDKAKTMVR